MKTYISILLISCAAMLSFSGVDKSQNQSNPIQYLALGDSYTIGESVPESDRWPVLLQKELKSKGYSVDPPKIIAKTGWRTDQLLEAIEGEKINSKYELVSLLIGVNNQYQGKPIDVFKEELAELIEVAIGLSVHGKDGVFMLSIPDYGVTPFAAKRNPEKISEEINLYNRICKEAALRYDIPFYDITDISRKATTDLSLLAEDKLHPSGKMYQQWVDSFLNSLIKKLTEKQGLEAK